MAEARARSVRIRGKAAGLFAAGYVVALMSFWIAGIVAFAQSGDGWSRLLGLAYFPILFRGSVWVWWFALQMVLAVAAIWLNPYERPRRRRPRVSVPRPGTSRGRSLARLPRV